MSAERFKPVGEDPAFGQALYDDLIPPDHFLSRLKVLIPWSRFSQKLVKYYRGRAKTGRPPYEPDVLLKMLLVAYLYNLSERQVEEVANFNLLVKCFLGLAVNERAPDHSTLTAFKRRLLDNGKLLAFEALLKEIVTIAREQGIEFGAIQVIDSVHTVANVNVDKDDKRQKKQGKPPRDPNARWGVKHSRRVKDESGKTIEQTEYFYGYKAHVSLNAATGLITSLVATPGNAYDGHLLPKLVENDLAQDLPVDIVTGDRGYDDSDNHVRLWDQGLHSALRLNAYRTQKKDANKQVWLEWQATPEYQEGLKERYKRERKFGEAKAGHGLSRCRYLGRVRYAIQGLLTAVALNLKRMVKLLAGVNFKGRARVTAWYPSPDPGRTAPEGARAFVKTTLWLQEGPLPRSEGALAGLPPPLAWQNPFSSGDCFPHLAFFHTLVLWSVAQTSRNMTVTTTKVNLAIMTAPGRTAHDIT